MNQPEFPVSQNEVSSEFEQDLLEKAATLKRAYSRTYALLGETLSAINNTKAYLKGGFKSMGDYAENGIGIGSRDCKDMQKVARGLRAMAIPDTDFSRFMPSTLLKLVGTGDAAYVADAVTGTEKSAVESLKSKRGVRVEEDSPQPTAKKAVFIATMRSEQESVVKEALSRFMRMYNTTEADNVVRGLFVEMISQEFLNMPETQAMDGTLTESDITGGA